MKAQTVNDISLQIAKLLGIPTEKTVSFTVTCEANEAPIVEIKQCLKPSESLELTTQRFTLVNIGDK